ncbi:MAG TPA: glycine cleavage system protein GcvH [Acidobacteriota bacterium]|jgi:glycine cleavage system H protein
MTNPENLKYTKDHEWLRVEGDTGVVGITDHAQHELGDVVFVELPELGRLVNAGEAFGSVESVKAVSEVYCPVSGEIIEVNQKLADKPELLNSEPYGAGWILKIKMKNPGEQAKLLTAADYTELTKGSEQ